MSVTSERLQSAMDEGRWNQAALARAIGVTQGAISAILLGNTQRSKYLPEIADALGISLAWLRGADVPRPTVRAASSVGQSTTAPILLQVLLPPERALARMFEGLLRVMPPEMPLAEQALLLAQRLPIGLSALRDLLPESVVPAPEAEREPAEALSTPASQSRS